MKLKMKTAGMIGITMGAFIIVLFLFIRPLIIDDAKLMDEESLKTDRARIESYIDSESVDLQQINRDWAIWDDTYQFMQDQNEGYIKSNLMLDTFVNNATNFMVFIDNSDKIIFAEGYDLKEETPLDIGADLPPIPVMISRASEGDGIAILDNEKYGHLLITNEEVLTSEGEGPAAGYLIMGKILDDAFFDAMKEDLALDMKVVPHAEESGAKIKEINEDKIVSTIQIRNDLDIKVQRDRKYYKEKLSSINNLFLVLSLATLLLVFLVYYLLDLFVLSRISYLSLQMKDINFEKQLSLEIQKSKTAKDEITDLENSIQEMLNSLEKAHAKVSNLAFYDQLTSLPNRFHLYKEFERRIETGNSAFTVLFFDLDGFKQVNDLHGHSSGDELLKQIGERLTGIAAKSGSRLFRIGGDEFILLSIHTERIELEKQIREMMQALRQDFILSKVTTALSTSVGISFYPSDAGTLDDLLQYADSAMYEAKKNGKNSFVFYEDLNNKKQYKHIVKLKNDLANAADNGQLYLEYQPIMENAGGRMRGVEALVRWNHPQYGVIGPLQFIPLAEEIGAIRSIGEWVIRNAVKHIKHWNSEHGETLTVAVNVSKAQLKNKAELLAVIDSVLAEYDFSAQLLQIEITESDTVAEDDEIADFTKELKMRNILVALDDFGVGTSSLFYLIKLNVDIVKIDRSFLQQVPASEKDTILLKGIYRALAELNIQVVTEGVETVEQCLFSESESESYLQGYYFSKPVPLAQLRGLQHELESRTVVK
ncbi:bifunctional diguanylate cyclase/phosphodiesterase [Planococcus sp. YIM B11945]|uniref:bifunctional diguanylate cyclase/phosphodiesterase n=1 Tax=Planococcus sp. YIM B11945 TaxID=3435410 RepID=UPI003D7DC63A